MERCSFILQDLEQHLNSNLRQTMCTRNRKKVCIVRQVTVCIVRQVTVWWAHVLVSVPQDPRELISSSIISRMMSPIRISFRCLHRLATSLVPKSSLIKWPALASASGLLATTMLCQPRAPSSQWMGSRLAPNVSKCSWNDQRMPINRTGEWVRWNQWPPIWRLFPQLTKQNWFGYDNPPVLLPYLYLCMVVCASCMLSQLCVCANIPQSLSEGLHATIQLPDVYIYVCHVVCMWWVMCMWCDCLPVLLSPDMCLRLPVCFVRLWSTSFYHLCSFPIHGALVSSVQTEMYYMYNVRFFLGL